MKSKLFFELFLSLICDIICLGSIFLMFLIGFSFDLLTVIIVSASIAIILDLSCFPVIKNWINNKRNRYIAGSITDNGYYDDDDYYNDYENEDTCSHNTPCNN